MSGGSGGGESISWVSVCILALAMVGVVSNAACVAILAWKKRSSMFHKLLKILSFYDSLVVMGCSFLYALPGTWNYFTVVIYPWGLPYVLPLTQISVMSSVYCTTLMSFERYARICYLCQLRSNKLLSERAFRLFISAVAIFPIIFYIPKFFEVRTEKVQRNFQMTLDCSNYTDLLQKIHTGNGSEYRFELEMIWNATSPSADQTTSELGVEIITTRDIFLECLQADFNALSASNMIFKLEKNLTMYQLLPTGLRQSVTYYQVYSIFLNTLFATLLPVILLFYLNMSTVRALARMKRMEQESEQEFIGLQSGVPAILVTATGARSSSPQGSMGRVETTVSTVDNNTQIVCSAIIKTDITAYSVSTQETRCHKKDKVCTAVQTSEMNCTSKPDSSEMQINSNFGESPIKSASGNVNSNVGESPKNAATGNGYDVIHSKVHELNWDQEQSENQNSIIVKTGIADAPKISREKVGSLGHIRNQIGSLRRSNRMIRQRSEPGRSDGSSDEHRKTEDRLTRISMSIVWIFLFCHVWKLIPTIYEAMYSGETQVLTDWPKWLLVVNDISHTLIVFNSAVNFLIYVVF